MSQPRQDGHPGGGQGLRVLFLHDRLSARGGADRHLLGVLDHLQGRAETLLAVGYDDGSLPPAERPTVGSWVRVKGLERSGLRPRGGRAALVRLERVAAEFAPAVIHINNVMDPALLQRAAELAPTVMTVQDHRLFCPGRGKLTPEGAICTRVMGRRCRECFEDQDYGRRMLELTRERLAALAGMARVLVLSGYMAGELVAAGVGPEKVEVLGPMVHGLAAGGSGGVGEYHLLAGRLVESKGVRVALAAAGLGVGARLVIAGDGPLAEEVARRARASGGRIQYVGWADRRQMARLLAGALSLWLPSLWAEPFGITGLEALSLGRPVVASAVGGVGDWLEHGAGGLLVPPGDAAALAAAARRLEDDRDLARRMGAAGREMVGRRFAAGPLMERLVMLYESLTPSERQR